MDHKGELVDYEEDVMSPQAFFHSCKELLKVRNSEKVFNDEVCINQSMEIP